MNDPMRDIALLLLEAQAMPAPKTTKDWRQLRDQFKKMAKICTTEAGRIRAVEIATHPKKD